MGWPHLFSFQANTAQDPNACQSPLAHVAVKSSPVNPFQLCWQPGSQSASNGIPRLTTAVQRRNHARLSEIVTRLQNFSGSVTELLAIASVQQQLDTAFADLNRAENQLKEVFRQFELQGHISKRQGCKQNCATRDLAKASQRIVQLTKELWDLQRRGTFTTNSKPLQQPKPSIISIAMCRVGTVIMVSPGCNHARQSGWQDSSVGTYLSELITRCSSCKPDQTFCGKLTIDSGLNAQSSSSTRRSPGVPQPPSLASLIQPTPEASRTANTLNGKCKFCTLYESEIRLADHIKQTLTDYNMALLFDEARLAVKAEMERAFQYAVDEAVRAYGIDGKGRDKALRTRKYF
ncbi:hypothetical protein NUW58_g5656 [Xylaria curta]|uniref:Uncharacterized protein n=1 Tax=Xylaria curta TaxID=42375 RepID=A0ACC1P124_9PEZI|nr:hypothetical protein NUW58_g5656 [Xylaria curta]